MGNIRSFKDLIVWQKAMDLAMDLAMEVFSVTRNFPPQERYSLTDQLRRSSRSVPANISEAWRKRRYPAAFVSKLSDADGEAAESQTHIEIARRCGFIDDAKAQNLDAAYEEVMAMLVSMMAHPDDWTIKSKRHSESGRHGDAETRRQECAE
jgi:four helix bundle protein